MAFNINGMMGTINANGGLTKASKFLVTITAPVQGTLLSDIPFFCEAAHLPGIAFQTDEIRMAGYGNIEKRPYATIFQDVQLTFLNDSDGKVLNFLHSWVQAVYNFNDDVSPYSVTAKGLPNNTFGYPMDYFGTVEIAHYDDAEDKVITYTLKEAYPINVGEIVVDWNSSDTLVKIPVTISYTYWVTETLDHGSVNEKSESRASALQGTQTRIDQNLANIRAQINTQSQQPTQVTVDNYAKYLNQR
ncbi:tail tube protein [uncultured Caudovirales phage]|uniref:Tail tube protein n=1 Tax=uncultured Caudovirales phage TaxID=2100421 RepID=A0A6J7WUC7_9CAUD|nr:tail tube protein [uncultured Caudovirales phage]